MPLPMRTFQACRGRTLARQMGHSTSLSCLSGLCGRYVLGRESLFCKSPTPPKPPVSLDAPVQGARARRTCPSPSVRFPVQQWPQVSAKQSEQLATPPHCTISRMLNVSCSLVLCKLGLVQASCKSTRTDRPLPPGSRCTSPQAVWAALNKSIIGAAYPSVRARPGLSVALYLTSSFRLL